MYFIELSEAISKALEISKDNNQIYIIWAYQNNTLPYPIKIIFQETLFSEQKKSSYV